MLNLVADRPALRRARWLLWAALSVFALMPFGRPVAAAETMLQVPILLYHRFGPALTDEMTVTTPVLESQLRLIQERGYHVIPLRSLLASLGDPANLLPERTVVVAVDDGHRTALQTSFR